MSKADQFLMAGGLHSVIANHSQNPSSASTAQAYNNESAAPSTHNSQDPTTRVLRGHPTASASGSSRPNADIRESVNQSNMPSRVTTGQQPSDQRQYQNQQQLTVPNSGSLSPPTEIINRPASFLPPELTSNPILSDYEANSLCNKLSATIQRIDMGRMFDKVVTADGMGNIDDKMYLELLHFFYNFVPMVTRSPSTDPICATTAALWTYKKIMSTFGEGKRIPRTRGPNRKHEWYSRPKGPSIFQEFAAGLEVLNNMIPKIHLGGGNSRRTAPRSHTSTRSHGYRYTRSRSRSRGRLLERHESTKEKKARETGREYIN